MKEKAIRLLDKLFKIHSPSKLWMNINKEEK